TLDADERAQVETMMSVDKDFTAMVEAWEHKLGVLNQMVGSVDPRPEVWDKIKAAVGHSEPQAQIVLPQAPPPVAPEVIEMSGNARRWRSVANFSSAIAAALVALIGFQIFQPDWLPEIMRPKPRTQLVEAKAPSVPAPSAQYVAVLQKDGG